MDANQRQILVEARAEVARFLSTYGEDLLDEAKLSRVDSRLDRYARDIIADTDRHNIWELLALKRFFSMLKSYRFDETAVKRVILCIETLKFPSNAGLKPLTLSPVQVFALAGIYGFYSGENRRLVRNAMLFVPRKFGKTTISSGIAIYELLFGDADGQVYTCANSYQQAKICFDNIRNCLMAIDSTGSKFKVNREVIYNKMKGHPSFARCLADNPKKLDGLNASCYIMDEFAQARSAELRNVMATSTGTRKNPLEIVITTASSLHEGPCVDTLKAYKEILLGHVQNDSVFALLFEPDVDDREDDPLTWHKVQPHLGVTIQEDYYAEQYAKAQLTSDNMLAFRTKLLNVFATDEQRTWIKPQEISDLFAPFDFDSLEGVPTCMVSFDLSVWDDFSVVCYEIYNQTTHKFHFHLDYYLPEDTLAKHQNADLYRRWRDKGFLKVLPGEVIDYEYLARDIIARNGKVRIAGITYDPYHSREMQSVLMAFGAGPVMKPMKQTYGTFTGAVEALELFIKTKNVTFSPNDITPWCFGNCNMDEDHLGNRKPIKFTHNLKIDGAICCLMSHDLYLNAKR